MIVFFKCPVFGCHFENIYKDEIIHHLIFTRDLGIDVNGKRHYPRSYLYSEAGIHESFLSILGYAKSPYEVLVREVVIQD